MMFRGNEYTEKIFLMNRDSSKSILYVLKRFLIDRLSHKTVVDAISQLKEDQ